MTVKVVSKHWPSYQQRTATVISLRASILLSVCGEHCMVLHKLCEIQTSMCVTYLTLAYLLIVQKRKSSNQSPLLIKPVLSCMIDPNCAWGYFAKTNIMCASYKHWQYFYVAQSGWAGSQHGLTWHAFSLLTTQKTRKTEWLHTCDYMYIVCQYVEHLMVLRVSTLDGL